jgi:adenosylhomocysteine nucleosidase
MRPRVAILAALPREIAPLVRDWPTRLLSRSDGSMLAECDRAVAVCAGMGRDRARYAFELATSTGPLSSVISVGFAGGLRPGMAKGSIHWPAKVIDAATGEHYACTGDGSGTLVTVDRVLDRESKRQVAQCWNADLADMEAAAVAERTRSRGLPFRTLRAVSDDADDRLPDLNAFTSKRGQFRQAAFAAFLITHPIWIPAAVRLGHNSGRAAREMARALRQVLEQVAG